MQICSVFASIINFIRGFDPLLLIFLVFALFIIGFWVFKKAIKVNYNAKKMENINLAWLMLVLIIFALAIFMVVIYV
ncbi:MAG: hypothetical protein ACI4TX_00435 [Christensenellales bacterium]